MSTRLALAATAAALTAYALLSAVPYLTDAQGHQFVSQSIWEHPRLLLDGWNRPLYGLVTAPFAALGVRVNQLAHVAIFMLAAWLTIRLARSSGIPRAALAAPLLAVQPVALTVATETLTDPLFLVTLLAATVLAIEGAPLASAAAIALAPLTRPEGVLLLPLWSVWAWRRSYAAAVVPWAGLAVWAAVGGLVSGDPLWLLSANPYGIEPGLRVVKWSYVSKFYDEVSGPILLPLAEAGLWSWWARARDRRWSPGIVAAGVLFLFTAFVRGNLEAGPPDSLVWRSLLPLGPWVAVFALEGLGLCLGRGSPRIPRWLRWSLAVQAGGAIVVAVTYGIAGHPYAPVLALLALGVAGATVAVLNPRGWLSARVERQAVAALLVGAAAFAVCKAPPPARTTGEAMLVDVVRWYESLDAPRPRVWTAMLAFHALTGTDPWAPNQTAELGERPFSPHHLIIWDDWTAGRHLRVDKATLLERTDLELVKQWRNPGKVPSEVLAFRGKR